MSELPATPDEIAALSLIDLLRMGATVIFIDGIYLSRSDDSRTLEIGHKSLGILDTCHLSAEGLAAALAKDEQEKVVKKQSVDDTRVAHSYFPRE